MKSFDMRLSKKSSSNKQDIARFKKKEMMKEFLMQTAEKLTKDILI